MPRFFLYAKGNDEGCGYDVVGCNEALKPLQSDNLEDARTEARQFFDDRWEDDSPDLGRFEILEANVHPCDFKSWIADRKAERELARDKRRLKELKHEEAQLKRRLRQ